MKYLGLLIAGILFTLFVANQARAKRYGVPVGTEQYNALYEQEGTWV